MSYKATAVSPANIAFIKYWGKRDSKLNLPYNNSISMNLSNCLTTTTVEFSARLSKNRVFIDGREVSEPKRARVVNILDIVRKKAKLLHMAKVVSENNFPADAGIASSASGFAALSLAASKAAGLTLSEKELSILARLGSGSACRSIADGFSEWKKGKSSDTSYAVQLASPGHWDIRDIVAVVAKEAKKKSSTEGHAAALTSPYYKARQRELEARVESLRDALLKRKLKKFGQLVEEEAIDLHLIAMTSRPPIFYWNKGTIEVVNKLHQWREEGFDAYFTMDAGPNVHVICPKRDTARLDRRLKRLPGVLFTIVNKPVRGVRLTKEKLF